MKLKFFIKAQKFVIIVSLFDKYIINREVIILS